MDCEDVMSVGREVQGRFGISVQRQDISQSYSRPDQTCTGSSLDYLERLDLTSYKHSTYLLQAISMHSSTD